MIRNQTRNTVLAAAPRQAQTLWERMRGMLGLRFNDGFDGLIFGRCDSIHTAFMGIRLDVLFLDRHGRVKALRQELPPWRLAAVLGSRTVVELPAGVIARSGTQVGDRVDLAGGPGFP